MGSGRASREKGKRGERELSKVIADLLGVECRRGQQFSGERGNPDVVGVAGVHIECKRVERLNLSQAVEQSVSDARDGEVPVVCHRLSRQPWLLTVRMSDLAQLVRALSDQITPERRGCDDVSTETGCGCQVEASDSRSDRGCCGILAGDGLRHTARDD